MCLGRLGVGRCCFERRELIGGGFVCMDLEVGENVEVMVKEVVFG